jgi:ribosome biogenesis protein Tsr3
VGFFMLLRAHLLLPYLLAAAPLNTGRKIPHTPPCSSR